MTSKLINNIRNSALVGLTVLAGGCAGKNPDAFEREEIVNGMRFRAFNIGGKRFAQVDADTSYNASPMISAHGFGKEGWREIYLDSISGNTPLLTYLNVDSLDAVYQRLANHAKLEVKK